MNGPLVQRLIEALGYRTFRVEVARRDDGAAVWRGIVRSLRRVVWCHESADLSDLFGALDAWLEADTHKPECRCSFCLEAEAQALELIDE